MGAGFSIRARGKTEAEILIYEDVGSQFFDGVTARQFAEQLIALGNIDVINLRISSLGGDVNEGLAIYRRLADHPAKVITHIDGYAASIASVIAMAGNEIRIAAAGAVMIHEAYGLAFGNALELRSIADQMEATTASIADVYVARTKNDRTKVLDWMAEETWFYGKEAVDAGFAQSVVENVRFAAHFDPSRHKFKHAPAALAGKPNLAEVKQRLARMKTQMERRRAA